ncbi:hypothetical protein [Methylicorpusculum sp.]|uniref:hypothetical protein n=1 Tax=Methylicorpusculum sp. TaxID=2713644 RepID=UPI00272EFE29|nr:hypothetical protein [Methylicorpusculum sp.]MDP2178378.1 hypothetical protein [Methylicorpusculum sp.]MDZ4152068.1 hypothetical protein [Methylicorpusculum sp.]
MYVDDAIVRLVGPASTGGQHIDFCVYHGHPNLVWAYVKNMPGILMWLLLPLHLLLNIVSIVYFSVIGRSQVILRAKIDTILKAFHKYGENDKLFKINVWPPAIKIGRYWISI